MPDLNAHGSNYDGVTGGKLKDGWTYDIERIPKSNGFRATVLHPYGDAASGGTPWPIEDPSAEADPAHPSYPTIDEAISAAARYVDMLSEVRGYPDPDKMSARGLRPALW